MSIQDQQASAGRVSDDPDALERDIERTRADMSSTLSALEKKLQPGEIAASTVDGFGTYLTGETGASLLDLARRNPVPTLLAGAGLVWLLLARRKAKPAAGQGTAWPEDSGLHDKWNERTRTDQDAPEAPRDRHNNAVEIALAAAGAVLGVTAAILTPISKIESRILNSARDDLWRQTRDLSQGLAETAIEAVQTAARAGFADGNRSTVVSDPVSPAPKG